MNEWKAQYLRHTYLLHCSPTTYPRPKPFISYWQLSYSYRSLSIIAPPQRLITDLPPMNILLLLLCNPHYLPLPFSLLFAYVSTPSCCCPSIITHYQPLLSYSWLTYVQSLTVAYTFLLHPPPPPPIANCLPMYLHSLDLVYPLSTPHLSYCWLT